MKHLKVLCLETKTHLKNREAQKARETLSSLCELLEKEPEALQKLFLEKILSLEGSCALLDLELYGTEEQKQIFNEALILTKS